MANQVTVYKGRTCTLLCNLGIDVSADAITSEIRTESRVESQLIATWTVSFVTDGRDGKLKLMLDNVITAQIKPTSGFMDLKRVTNGEPVPVFDGPIEVVFKGSVTQ